MENEIKIFFCSAEAFIFGKLLTCGLIAKYKLGNKNKIFFCEIHCPDDQKTINNLI